MPGIDIPINANMYMPPVSGMRLSLVDGGPFAEGDHFFESFIGTNDMTDVRGLYVSTTKVGLEWGHQIGYRDFFGTYNFDEYIPWLYQVVAFGRTRSGSLIPTEITNVPYRSWLVPLAYADLAAVAIHVQPTVEIQMAALVVAPAIGP